MADIIDFEKIANAKKAAIADVLEFSIELQKRVMQISEFKTDEEKEQFIVETAMWHARRLSEVMRKHNLTKEQFREIEDNLDPVALLDGMLAESPEEK